MKKTVLYTVLAASMLGMSSCDEDYKDWAEPLKNTPEEANGPLSGSVKALVSDLKFENYADASVSVPVMAYVSTENAADVQSVRVLNLYVNGHEIPFTQNEGDTLSVTVHELDSVVAVAYNSLAYTQRSVELTVKAGVDLANGESVLVNSDAASFSYTPADVIPACHKQPESAYYYIGTYNGWNLAAPTQMTPNGDGSYSVEIEVGDSEWFAFAPQSAVDAQNWGILYRAKSKGASAMSDFFGLDPTCDNSFCLETGGLYRFTIHPADYWYKVEPIAKELYYVGAAVNWSSFCPMAETANGFVGYYYVVDTGGFKFTTTPDWNNPQYGAGADANSIALGGGDISMPAGLTPGFYQITVDTKALTFSLAPISAVSIIGSATGDPNWGTDLDLSFDANELAWVGTVDLVAGEFKFRADHGWALSWGGTSATDLTSANGANLNVAEAGKYKVKFKPNCDGKGEYSMERQ